LTTLLYNREILRTYFTKNIYKLDSSISYENSEIEFISKITGLIKDKIDDSTFGVEQLADTLEISRVQLYRKIKAVMGISISDYIQSIKLDHAKKLLETTDLSISDVAYSAGFSSPNYFSTSFKGKFGKTPKSFRLSFSN
jgi:AraC-like DNA-binding protein